jgi:hypothetical protein
MNFQRVALGTAEKLVPMSLEVQELDSTRKVKRDHVTTALSRCSNFHSR